MIPLLVTLTVLVGVGRFFAHRQTARQRLELAELRQELLDRWIRAGRPRHGFPHTIGE